MKFIKFAQVPAIVFVCAAFAFGQQLRGYSVGRYEGQAKNTTRNAAGKVVVEIQTIDAASGAVSAHLTASDGLTGDGDLTGKIDAAGVLRLADVQAYNYDVFKNQLIFMVKAKVESRPDSFKFDYLDADGVVVASQTFYGLWHAELLAKPEKFAVGTSTESQSQMAKVKTVRVVRIVQ